MTILREPQARGHQESHAALVEFQTGVAGARSAIDAIVVPTARRARHLGPVADLAGSVGCLLVVICSARAKDQVVVDLVRAARACAPPWSTYRPATSTRCSTSEPRSTRRRARQASRPQH
jgi:hypothetical protein